MAKLRELRDWRSTQWLPIAPNSITYLFAFWAALAMILLLFPFLALVGWSLWGKEEIGYFSSAPTYFWLMAQVANADFLAALLYSLLIAITVTPICGLVISILDYSTVTMGRIWQASIYSTSTFIVLFPVILYALATRVWIVPTVQSSIVATILAQVTFFSATGLLFVSSFKSPRRPLLISAARTMGARSTSIFFGVNLPLRRPAIAGTCALIFALSIDESVFSIFVLSDNVRTVPRYIWNHVGYVNDPSMAAAAIIVLLVLVPFYLVPLGALRWWRREDVSHD